MKRLLLIPLFAFTSIVAIAQQSSPYVETGSSVINNSGFKAASIRTTPFTNPTPVHLQNNSLNYTFPTRFAVAKADVLLSGVTGMRWAEANGWTTAANSSSTSNIVAIVPTGCNAYFELGTTAGQWRLPTQREMILIVLTRIELLNQGGGFVALTGTYWTATQSGATTSWSYDIAIGSMYSRSKTTNYKARCIRDL